ncbi:MAG: hypothetical protein L3J89_11005, partial [Gammaproteobacteria bacterium]|nr:hypothetical protein [Gammaproteobacteria bacterium]
MESGEANGPPDCTFFARHCVFQVNGFVVRSQSFYSLVLRLFHFSVGKSVIPTLYAIDKLEKLPDFVARHCHETSATEQASICKIVAKYNGHYPNQPLLANE